MSRIRKAVDFWLKADTPKKAPSLTSLSGKGFSAIKFPEDLNSN